ncbi:MAG: DNA mismatch repair endonuclease MutL [Calditrichaeota bacterium]|nr:MAG: DNA mismatch repair endonuclease MutL [Calditrichota bacterium]MBL1204372.1 DNA mismatch repair endonuclease MutL [Calditrichota bacterium]NOG44201.1 DNA mismatch repair endonuclease MutL [Calditrichota bacterium]
MDQTSSKVQILPEHLANKIAAGEVVERPASVVKELIENAIDSGANSIQVHISGGGKKLIQVIDNGCGIGELDLPVAFERHATSKIRSEKDLESIHSLGFRGEALPSIASVAQVEIKTKEQSEKLGLVYSIDGGRKGHVKKIAANTGTSISIKNLFFNTPARRKFLKSDNAESQQILLTLKRFFLAYPDIEFQLHLDDKQLFLLKKTNLKERIVEVFGQDLEEGLIEIDTSVAGIEINGFIAKPKMARRSRTHQHLFLNGRPIQDRNISYAVYQGFGETLDEGAHPVFCLFIEMDPNFVDVNIHPTKMQVRFSNDRTLFYLFLNSVKKALNDSGILADLSSDDQGSAIQKAVIEHDNDTQKSIKNEFDLKKIPLKETGLRRVKKSSGQTSLAYFNQLEETPKQNEVIGQKNLIPSENLDVRFWQVHQKYIFSEIKSGLVIVDQHLAHSRILYEKTIKILDNKSIADGQKLLFPQKITLALDDFLVFRDVYSVLNQIGFTINVFSGNTIIIEEMPSDVKIGRESQILLDIIDYYKNTPQGSFNPNEKIAAAYAFKNAIKTGEPLNEFQMHNLVDQLFACEHPFYSPNGKPVIVSMELDELARKFK